jgi:lipopolysaccharide biosynthesis glycosyltransferase
MALNKGYVKPTTVAMYSICANAKEGVQLKFWLLNNDLGDTEREFVRAKLDIFKDKYTVEYLDIPREYYDRLPCVDKFGKETWYRVLIPLLMPQLDKVLYLDGDIIVLDDLSELYNTNIESSAYAACSEKKPLVWQCNPIVHTRQHFKFRFFDKIGLDILDEDTQYVNAGVMLINCEYWRKHNYLGQILEFADRYKDDTDYKYPDQDAINCVANNDTTSNIKYVSLKYNFPPNILQYKRYNPIVLQTYLKMLGVEHEAHEGWQPAIFHFAGVKPWKGAKYQENTIYRDYASKIGWKIPRRQLNVKLALKNTFKFWVPNGLLKKLTK